MTEASDKTQLRLAEDFAVESLKKKFLMLAPGEKYPHTPKITESLDYIIDTIKQLEAENAENLLQK
jgi:hypothetical protein